MTKVMKEAGGGTKEIEQEERQMQNDHLSISQLSVVNCR